MSLAITMGGERYQERMELLKILAGPGFGGNNLRRPDKDPNDKDQSLLERGERWLKQLYHSLYCWWINAQYPHPKTDSSKKPPAR